LCFCPGLAVDHDPLTYASLIAGTNSCEPPHLAFWLRWES
jgi:hypothetical protein